MTQTTQIAASEDRSSGSPAGSIMDMCKVVVFLGLAIVARNALTEQHTSHVEGVSEPQTRVASPILARAPDLIDLSTVGF
mgnify:CR=1 FL=1